MSIRQADLEDIDAVLSVINKSNAEAYRKIIPTEYFREPVFTLDELLKKFDEMTFYAYELEGNIVGVAALQTKGDDVGQVRFAYVLPDHQGRGVGTSLVTYIEARAKKLGLKRLRVPFVNEKAQWAMEFYKKLGYRIVDKIERPWGNDVFFEKTLSE